MSFVIAFKFQAVIFSMLVFSGGNEFVQKPVSQWSNDDVMVWLGGLGDWASHNISRTFAKEVFSLSFLKQQISVKILSENHWCSIEAY